MTLDTQKIELSAGTEGQVSATWNTDFYKKKKKKKTYFIQLQNECMRIVGN
jgi:hypothetical protein